MSRSAISFGASIVYLAMSYRAARQKRSWRKVAFWAFAAGEQYNKGAEWLAALIAEEIR